MHPADLLYLDPGYVNMRAEDGGFGPNMTRTRDDGGQGGETLGGLDPLFSRNLFNLVDPTYVLKLDPGYVPVYPALD